MRTSAPKPPNGKGLKITCPNAPECVVAQSAADTLSVLDARFTRVEEALLRLHEEALDFRRMVLESHDQVLKALQSLEAGED